MKSKIIQKEKEQQKINLKICPACEIYQTRIVSNMLNRTRCPMCFRAVTQHKQSLINLKEYMEEEIEKLKPANSGIPLLKFDIIVHRLEDDIEELNKMIKRYDE